VRKKPAINFSLPELSHRINTDSYINTKECAWFTHLGESTLKQMRAAQTGPPWHLISTRVLYKPSEVSRWLEQRKNGGAR
jgi:hypothetical protein